MLLFSCLKIALNAYFSRVFVGRKLNRLPGQPDCDLQPTTHPIALATRLRETRRWDAVTFQRVVVQNVVTFPFSQFTVQVSVHKLVEVELAVTSASEVESVGAGSLASLLSHWACSDLRPWTHHCLDHKTTSGMDGD